MTLLFRNVNASPEDPVEDWPVEAIRSALERGGLEHWRRLAAAISTDPWGPMTRQVEQVLIHARPYGVAELMERVIADARARAEAGERAHVRGEIAALLDEAGCTQEEFASRIGTSASRFSTYLSGKVVPSAALLVRMRAASAGITSKRR